MLDLIGKRKRRTIKTEGSQPCGQTFLREKEGPQMPPKPPLGKASREGFFSFVGTHWGFNVPSLPPEKKGTPHCFQKICPLSDMPPNTGETSKRPFPPTGGSLQSSRWGPSRVSQSSQTGPISGGGCWTPGETVSQGPGWGCCPLAPGKASWRSGRAHWGPLGATCRALRSGCPGCAAQ